VQGITQNFVVINGIILVQAEFCCWAQPPHHVGRSLAWFFACAWRATP